MEIEILSKYNNDNTTYDFSLKILKEALEIFLERAPSEKILTVQKDTKDLFEMFTQLPTFTIAKEMSELFALNPTSEYVRTEDYEIFKKSIIKQLDDIKSRMK